MATAPTLHPIMAQALAPFAPADSSVHAQAGSTVAQRHAELIADCRHLLHAIDRGYYGESIASSSAFVMPLRVAVADFDRRRGGALDRLLANDADLIGEGA